MSLSRVAALPAAVVALALAGAAPASASPARPRPLPCHASMSNARPADYTTVYVRVRTASRAKVVTIAHYRTTSHRKSRQANGAGRARVPYYISGATPHFKVKVSVRVSRHGRTGSCSTSFTPHR
ncbi:MAG: hypothetical protein ACRDRJ_21685 [Streptosporangiaceae bacterium]